MECFFTLRFFLFNIHFFCCCSDVCCLYIVVNLLSLDLDPSLWNIFDVHFYIFLYCMLHISIVTHVLLLLLSISVYSMKCVGCFNVLCIHTKMRFPSIIIFDFIFFGFGFGFGKFDCCFLSHYFSYS